ncbi:hypothetical protein K1719_031019 [Acacia pycnantha]|nr:hypothetical protein K1719_031019 [Acacia pycnantha]
MEGRRSIFQDEAKYAGEQPLTHKRSIPTPLSSTDLAKNADFIETSLMSSSGSRDSINNSQHSRSAIQAEELVKNPSTHQRFWLPLLYDFSKTS